MTFTDEYLVSLKEKVKGYMGGKRFSHTLGVEATARRIAEAILPDMKGEVRAAAILHDVAKEISREEQLFLIEKEFPDTDLTREAPATLHAFAAVGLIKRDFPEAATERILSSVFCHTTGKADMSLFDKIIFLSDYIEEGRAYPLCVYLRRDFFKDFDLATDSLGKERALNVAVLTSIENTISSLSSRGSEISELTYLARKSISALI